ncbi:hypothetical protein PG994_009462 [Apiospora phragmitis]|uniref:CFEM domain-containing protein n=1 Tax=Apiospora phragmitis TaxID=2905665 RepID=A0ABR1UMC7_9PEZI
MKASFILASAALAAAQGSFPGVPDCAVGCIRDALPKVGCGLDDKACQCNSDTKSRITPIITPCMFGSCSMRDLLKAQKAGDAHCKRLGYRSVAARGEDFYGLPQCAIPCIKESLPKVGCTVGDMACQCNDDKQAALTPIVAPCMLSSCTSAELSQALEAGVEQCDAWASQPTNAPETTKAPESTKAKETSKVPESTKAEETTKVVESTKAAEETTKAAETTSCDTTANGSSKPTETPAPYPTTTISASVAVVTSKETATASGHGAIPTTTTPSYVPVAAAATQGVAKLVGGVLAGAVGIVAAL